MFYKKEYQVWSWIPPNPWIEYRDREFPNTFGEVPKQPTKENYVFCNPVWEILFALRLQAPRDLFSIGKKSDCRKAPRFLHFMIAPCFKKKKKRQTPQLYSSHVKAIFVYANTDLINHNIFIGCLISLWTC